MLNPAGCPASTTFGLHHWRTRSASSCEDCSRFEENASPYCNSKSAPGRREFMGRSEAAALDRQQMAGKRSLAGRWVGPALVPPSQAHRQPRCRDIGQCSQALHARAEVEWPAGSSFADRSGRPLSAAWCACHTPCRPGRWTRSSDEPAERIVGIERCGEACSRLENRINFRCLFRSSFVLTVRESNSNGAFGFCSVATFGCPVRNVSSA